MNDNYDVKALSDLAHKLQQENKRLRKGLEDIVKHYSNIAPTLVKYSPCVAIAKKALGVE